MIKIFKLVRIDQWLKNLLIFLPIIISGNFEKFEINKALVFFFIFSLAASFIYIFNDLIDYNSDKAHPTKKKRLIASNQISKKNAIIIGIIIFILSIAFSLKYKVLNIIILYYFTNILYNFIFKKKKILDIICLSFFYVIKIYYGGLAFNIEISNFLVLFSFLIFFSLGLIKRLNEVKKYNKLFNIYNKKNILFLSNALSILNYIITSFFLYYIFTDTIVSHVKNPKILLFAVPLIFIWMHNISTQAKKGLLDDNIIKYVSLNKKSILIILITLLIMIKSQT